MVIIRYTTKSGEHTRRFSSIPDAIRYTMLLDARIKRGTVSGYTFTEMKGGDTK